MKLEHLVLDQNNLFALCRASFCHQININLSWEWQIQVLHTEGFSAIPLAKHWPGHYVILVDFSFETLQSVSIIFRLDDWAGHGRCSTSHSCSSYSLVSMDGRLTPMDFILHSIWQWHIADYKNFLLPLCIGEFILSSQVIADFGVPKLCSH